MRLRSLLRPLTLLVALALVAAACSGDDEAAPPDTTGPSASGEAPIQDLWVLVRMQTPTADGEMLDLVEVLTEPVEAGAGAEVDMGSGVSFRPTPDLGVDLVTAEGEVRDDVTVDVGLLDYEDESGLVVLATPDAGADPVAWDDELRMDLSLVADDVTDGAALVTDYVFAQTFPATDDEAAAAEDGTTSLELLSLRMGRRGVAYTALEGDDTPLGMAGQVGEISLGDDADDADDAGGGGADADGDDAAAAGAGYEVVLTRAGGGSDGGGSGGGPAGGIPPKAQPMIEGLGKGFFACRKGFGTLGCVRKYFQKFGQGAAESLGGIDDQLGPDPTPDPPECTSNCGSSNNEPHLRTFDGKRYDLQTAGELVAARTDGLEVQVRTEPYQGSDRVSVNTSVAVGVGDQRVTATLQDDGDAVVRIDGEERALDELRAESVALDGGSVEVRTGTLLVTSDDGTVVRITGIGGSTRLNVVVDVGEGVTDWEGLFGDIDGDTDNDLVPQGGTEPIDPSDDAALYDEFANSWRVTDETSLFDYADGEDTETFTDLDFPEEPATLDTLDPAGRGIAELVCEAAQIQDPTTFDDCVLDYALTQDVAFVTGAQLADGVELVATGQLIVGDLATALVDIGTADEGAGSGDLAWLVELPGRTTNDDRGGEVVVGDGFAVVRSSDEDDVHHLTAVDLTTGEERWDVADVDRDCAPVVTPAGVVTQLDPQSPTAGEDQNADLAVLDPATGEITSRWEPAEGEDQLRQCEVALTATDDGTVYLVEPTEVVRAFSTDGGLAPLWSIDLDPRQALGWAPVAGGAPHLLLRDGATETVALARLDPATGAITSEVGIEGIRGFGQDADSMRPVTDDLLAVLGQPPGGEPEPLVVVRTGDELVIEWSRPFGEGAEIERRPNQVDVADGLLGGWSDVDGAAVIALDLTSGDLEWSAPTSSFDNTGNQVSGVDGVGFLVSPFGGAWLEALWEGEQRWAIDEVPGLDSPTTHTPVGDQLVVTGSIAPDAPTAGVYVALVPLDR